MGAGPLFPYLLCLHLRMASYLCHRLPPLGMGALYLLLRPLSLLPWVKAILYRLPRTLPLLSLGKGTLWLPRPQRPLRHSLPPRCLCC